MEEVENTKMGNEKQKTYNSSFYQKNIEKIKQKVVCPECYGTYTYFNKSRHLKTARHKTAVGMKQQQNPPTPSAPYPEVSQEMEAFYNKPPSTYHPFPEHILEGFFNLNY